MAKATNNQDLAIQSLRGGMNTQDSPHTLPEDQCVLAENVEFFYSTLGERRGGCAPVSITNNLTPISSQDVVVHINQRFPTNDVLAPELWVTFATPKTSVTVTARQDGEWRTIVQDDLISPSVPEVYEIQTQELHGKTFWAYKNETDRLHIWDGTKWRKTGLKQPEAAPTAVDEGSGAYVGTRFFRIRYVEKLGDVVQRRSEPSDSVTFEPSGTGAGATITRPGLINEGETDWEVEASENDADYYRITTLPIATTTYNDEAVLEVEDYADLGPLSEDIGEYLTQPSVKYVVADGDRLILGGHWDDPDRASRVYWSPAFNAFGAGNDERQPLDADNYVDLDNYEGGSLTGLSQTANGTWYAFKWLAIYKFTRTGDATRAYQATAISKSRGAIPGSIISGMDEQGRGCIYFLDPVVGPSRLSASGLQAIKGMRSVWKRVNLDADIVARGCYYPDKQQVHWWVAVDGNTTPNYKMVLQVSESRTQQDGVVRGWSVATGRIAEAYCVAVINEVEIDDTAIGLSERPFIGLTSPDYVQRCDTNVSDAGIPYIATIRTKPYFLTGILNKSGVMRAGLFATSLANYNLVVKVIRNFGTESNEIITDLLPPGDEEFCLKIFDNLVMSTATDVQFEFSDPPDVPIV